MTSVMVSLTTSYFVPYFFSASIGCMQTVDSEKWVWYGSESCPLMVRYKSFLSSLHVSRNYLQLLEGEVAITGIV